ncbi:EAL domain-containing protein [Sulfuritalea sp.]|uniref:EAL domain-containing protein n=1 Tax=Sulfuritalea sp. TaxID=2480090 RepID=UPI00286E096D|nr:EAL domain-containing protein [Sulfuritalea sp.]
MQLTTIEMVSPRPPIISRGFGSLLPGFALAVFLALFSSGAAQALTSVKQSGAAAQKSLPANQTQKDTLVVGSEQDYPPFATGMTDATAGGFTVDLWKAVAAEASLNFTIRVLPFHQILQEFKEGKIDVLINLARSDERNQFADFTVPHVVVNGAIFVRKGDSKINSEDDLAGKSLIVLNADLAHDYAVLKGWKKQLVLVDAAAEGFRLLASGKHDAMLLGKLSGMQTLQALGLTHIKALKAKVEFSQKFAFAVQKGQSELLAKINEGLALTKSNGAYDALYDKWFGIYEVKEVGLRDMLKYIIPIVLVFLGIGGYFFYRRKIERKQAEGELRISAVAFASQNGMMITDAKGVILRVNPAFTHLTGYSSTETIGQTPALLNSGRQDRLFYQRMWESMKEKGYWKGEIWNKRKNGQIYAEMLTITAIVAPDQTITHYVGSFSDITEDKEAEAEIHRLAYYDPLTRLPNRRLLQDRLGQAVAAAARSRLYGAVFFIDLDNFKALNDTRGHDVGDLLLVAVAQRLRAGMREGDTVARQGGDEFVLLVEDLGAEANEAATLAKQLGEKLRETIDSPFTLNAYEYHCRLSVGVSLFNAQDTVEDLLKHADLALYQAKRAGRNTLRFFDPAMQSALDLRSALEVELRQALKRDELRLYYQPQVDAAGRVIGVEALLRWQHTERGLVQPNDFIPLAEDTGLILPIGLWVLETACAQLKTWEGDARTRELQVAVNVSARQFRQPDFVAQIQSVLETSGAIPARLKLELTESMVLEDIEDTIEKMQAIKRLGVNFSMDDFGTGYSSLSYLAQLPLDQIKIDKAFVCSLPGKKNDETITRTIITLGRELAMNVIAEGVETEAQREFLELHGCHAYQGYLFSRPLPLAEFEEFVKQV